MQNRVTLVGGVSGYSGVGDSPHAQGASIDGLKLVREGASEEASGRGVRIPRCER